MISIGFVMWAFALLNTAMVTGSVVETAGPGMDVEMFSSSVEKDVETFSSSMGMDVETFSSSMEMDVVNDGWLFPEEITNLSVKKY